MTKTPRKSRAAVVRFETALDLERTRSAALERILVDELGQELVGIALMVAAARTPLLETTELNRRLHRIAELLSAAARRCAVAPARLETLNPPLRATNGGFRVH